MRRNRMHYPAFLLLLLFLASVSGVFASWVYPGPVTDKEADLPFSVNGFEWAPEEILPTETEIGQNHLALIQLILNERDKGYGLNSTGKQVLESYLKKNGIIFSNQKTTGGNIKFVSDASRELYYCIEKINDTMFYAYTFTYSDLNAAKGTSTSIPVYRTVLEKVASWHATKSYFGYAQTKRLDELVEDASNLSGELAYSIDPSTWDFNES